MQQAGGAYIPLKLDLTQFNQAISVAMAGLQKIGLAAAGIYAIKRAFTDSAKAAIEFNRQMHNVWTLTDKTRTQMELLGRQVRALAREYNTTSSQSASALYQIYSATFYGADAMKILEASTKGAAAGLSNVFSVADMMTTVLNAWHLSASQAAHINDLLFTTIKYGKVTMSELANEFGRLAGIAAPAGAHIEEMTAAIATLTRQGIATDWSITALRQSIMQLLRPGKMLANAIKDLGYSSGRALIEQNGFANALKIVADYAKENGIRMEQLFSNVRAVTAVLPLATTAAADYAKDLKRASEAAGTAQMAFEKQTESWSYQLAKTSSAVNDMAISVGDFFVPGIVAGAKAVEFLASGLRLLFDILTKVTAAIGSVIDAISSGINAAISLVSKGINTAASAIGHLIGISGGSKKVSETFSAMSDKITAVSAALASAAANLKAFNTEADRAKFGGLYSGITDMSLGGTPRSNTPGFGATSGVDYLKLFTPQLVSDWRKAQAAWSTLTTTLNDNTKSAEEIAKAYKDMKSQADFWLSVANAISKSMPDLSAKIKAQVAVWQTELGQKATSAIDSAVQSLYKSYLEAKTAYEGSARGTLKHAMAEEQLASISQKLAGYQGALGISANDLTGKWKEMADWLKAVGIEVKAITNDYGDQISAYGKMIAAGERAGNLAMQIAGIEGLRGLAQGISQEIEKIKGTTQAGLIPALQSYLNQIERQYGIVPAAAQAAQTWSAQISDLVTVMNDASKTARERAAAEKSLASIYAQLKNIADTTSVDAVKQAALAGMKAIVDAGVEVQPAVKAIENWEGQITRLIAAMNDTQSPMESRIAAEEALASLYKTISSKLDAIKGTPLEGFTGDLLGLMAEIQNAGIKIAPASETWRQKILNLIGVMNDASASVEARISAEQSLRSMYSQLAAAAKEIQGTPLEHLLGPIQQLMQLISDAGIKSAEVIDPTSQAAESFRTNIVALEQAFKGAKEGSLEQAIALQGLQQAYAQAKAYVATLTAKQIEANPALQSLISSIEALGISSNNSADAIATFNAAIESISMSASNAAASIEGAFAGLEAAAAKAGTFGEFMKNVQGLISGASSIQSAKDQLERIITGTGYAASDVAKAAKFLAQINNANYPKPGKTFAQIQQEQEAAAKKAAQAQKSAAQQAASTAKKAAQDAAQAVKKAAQEAQDAFKNMFNIPALTALKQGNWEEAAHAIVGMAQNRDKIYELAKSLTAVNGKTLSEADVVQDLISAQQQLLSYLDDEIKMKQWAGEDATALEKLKTKIENLFDPFGALKNKIKEILGISVTQPFAAGSELRKFIDVIASHGIAAPQAHFQTGGPVPGAGIGDKIPAMLEPGEFVIPNWMLRIPWLKKLVESIWKNGPRLKSGGPALGDSYDTTPNIAIPPPPAVPQSFINQPISPQINLPSAGISSLTGAISALNGAAGMASQSVASLAGSLSRFTPSVPSNIANPQLTPAELQAIARGAAPYIGQQQARAVIQGQPVIPSPAPNINMPAVASLGEQGVATLTNSVSALGNAAYSASGNIAKLTALLAKAGINIPSTPVLPSTQAYMVNPPLDDAEKEKIAAAAAAYIGKEMAQAIVNGKPVIPPPAPNINSPALASLDTSQVQAAMNAQAKAIADLTKQYQDAAAKNAAAAAKDNATAAAIRKQTAAIPKTLEELKAAFKEAKNSSTAMLAGLIKNAKVGGAVWNALWSGYDAIISQDKNLISQFQLLGRGTRSLRDHMLDTEASFRHISPILVHLAHDLDDFSGQITDFVRAAFGDAAASLAGQFMDAGKKLLAVNWGDLADSATMTKKALSHIGDAGSSLIKGAFSKVGSSLLSGGGAIFSAAESFLSSGALTVITAVINIVDEFGKIINAAAEEVKKNFQMVARYIQGFIDGAWRELQSRVNVFIDSLNSLITATKNYQDIQSALAKIQGGIFNLLLGFLAPIAALLGQFADLLGKSNEQLGSSLNVPTGYKVTRNEWAAATPGEPGIKKGGSETQASWVSDLMKKFGDEIKEIIDKFKKFIGILTDVAQKIGEAIFPAILQSLSWFVDQLMGLGEHIQKDLLPIFVEYMPKVIKGALDFLFGSIVGSATFFVDTFAAILPSLAGLSDALSDIGKQLPGLGAALGNAAGAIISTFLDGAITPFAKFVSSTLLPDLQSRLVSFTAWWGKEMDPFLQSEVFPALGKAAQWLYRQFRELINFLGPKVMPLLKDLWKIIQDAWNSTIKPMLQDLVNWIKRNWPMIKAFIENSFKDLLKSISTKIQRAADYFKWKIADGANNAFATMKAIYTSKSFSLWEKMGLIWKSKSLSLWDKVTQSFGLGVKGVFQGIAGFFGGIFSGIGNFFSGIWNGIRGIFHFQEGGVVPGPIGAPHLAIVHGGELVVPHPNIEPLPTNVGSGGTIAIKNYLVVDGRVLAESVNRVSRQNDKLMTGSSVGGRAWMVS